MPHGASSANIGTSTVAVIADPRVPHLADTNDSSGQSQGTAEAAALPSWRLVLQRRRRRIRYEAPASSLAWPCHEHAALGGQLLAQKTSDLYPMAFRTSVTETIPMSLPSPITGARDAAHSGARLPPLLI